MAMVTRTTALALFSLACACGGKIAPDTSAASASPAPETVSSAEPAAEAPRDTPIDPPTDTPAGGQCYAGADRVPGVSCAFVAGAGGGGGAGARCHAELDCEGHRFVAECAGGLCRCENVGYSACFCRERDELACTGASCCWR